MFTPEERTRTMDGVVTWTYIICVVLLVVVGGLAGGVCGMVFTAKATGGALIGAIVGGFLGYWAAWWQDFWVYTTFIRVDEMLLEMRDMRKCQEDKLSKSLLDIKAVLETIAAVQLAQNTSSVTSGEQLPTQDGASPAVQAVAVADLGVIPANVNKKDEDGQTVLMKAITDGKDCAAIKALIAAGADVNAKDSYGKTDLMWAASQSTDANVVKALIDAGADVEARDNIWKSAIQYLEARRDYDTFCATAAYSAMRQMLSSSQW